MRTNVNGDASRFDADGVANRGFEADCPSVTAGGAQLNDASVCTAMLCDASRINDDGNTNHGCEAGYPIVAGGSREAHSDAPARSPTASAMTATPTKSETRVVPAMQAKRAQHDPTPRRAKP